MFKDLPRIVDLLDQAYGVKKPGEKEHSNSRVYKGIVGVMMARIVQCKALAAAVESGRPGTKEHLRTIFDPENRDRPFLEVMKYLWGPDLDAKRGFLASIAGGRTRFIFEGIPEAEMALKDAREIMVTNDQDPKGRGKTAALNTIGFTLDVVQAIARGGGGRR
jgi:hypothetical protein